MVKFKIELSSVKIYIYTLHRMGLKIPQALVPEELRKNLPESIFFKNPSVES